jgi:hypothetical protein
VHGLLPITKAFKLCNKSEIIKISKLKFMGNNPFHLHLLVKSSMTEEVFRQTLMITAHFMDERFSSINPERSTTSSSSAVISR